MRLISLKEVADNMVLAKTLRDEKGNILLPAGSDLMGYVNQMKGFNIKFLYVDDKISEGIVAKSILSDDTRVEIGKMMPGLKKKFKQIEGNPIKHSLTISEYKKLAKKIVNDIMEHKDFYIDLTELRLYRSYTFGHSLCVGIISSLIAKLLQLSRLQIEAVCMGGLFHDIGMICVPDGLSKGFKKADDVYKQHPHFGYNLIKNDSLLDIMTKTAIFQHHERIDGSGYPLHKRDEQISLSAKIVSIAENYDELLNGRNIDYGPIPMKMYEVIEYMQNYVGTIFDVEIMSAFVKNFTVFPNGTVVRLSDNRKGIVINQNNNLITRPIIRITHDSNDKPTLDMVNLLEDNSLVVNHVESL